MASYQKLYSVPHQQSREVAAFLWAAFHLLIFNIIQGGRIGQRVATRAWQPSTMTTRGKKRNIVQEKIRHDCYCCAMAFQCPPPKKRKHSCWCSALAFQCQRKNKKKESTVAAIVQYPFSVLKKESTIAIAVAFQCLESQDWNVGDRNVG